MQACDVVVVDGKDGPTRESRALVVQARSIEIYDQLGISDEVLKKAQRAVALAPGFRSRVFGRIPLGAAGEGVTPFPWIEVLEQSKNEEILYANLRKLGGDVRWGSFVTALAESGDGVEATVGDDTVRARFCVGTDGANSVVRKSRDIAFDGVTNPHLFYVIDAVGTAGLVDGAINVRPGGEDFLIAFPMVGRGNWRLIGLARDSDGDGEVTEKDACDRMRTGFAVTYAESRWFATYRVHHRVAAAFRDGPFFLAGDAAHVHSPLGGQGMNTGIGDAMNLGWKLADAARGSGPSWLLDSYESERHPVGASVLRTTDAFNQVVLGNSKVQRLLRSAVLQTVTRLPPTRRLLAGRLSGIDIAYKRRRGDHRMVGRRMPDIDCDGTRLYELLREAKFVLVTARPVEVDRPGVVHVVGEHPGLPDAVLVRPDGYVAWASDRMPTAAELAAAVDHWHPVA
jgi:2-polyprenyl-6-methoxyphenol hydroxylase-like FAD-dependent oxidoreductase